MGRAYWGIEEKISVASFVYDFSEDGGAVGDILLGDKIIPKNAVIIGGLIDVKTAPDSGGSATIALKVKDAGDVLAATAITSLGAGLHDVVPDFTASNMIKTTAASQLTMTVGTAALTAGRFIVKLFYIVTE